jgi:hypothetical protein
MKPFDRRVRSMIYRLLVEQVREVDAVVVAEAGGWARHEVEASLHRLADAHRLALTPGGLVWMAHPFSGVPTGYRATVGDAWWHANCAWDALAILSLLGDGVVTGPSGPLWRADDGVISPDGFVHLVVPARSFWEDVGFT